MGKTVCANSTFGTKLALSSVMHVISHRPHSSDKYAVMVSLSINMCVICVKRVQVTACGWGQVIASFGRRAESP